MHSEAVDKLRRISSKHAADAQKKSEIRWIGFAVIIDSLFAALQKRSQAYEGISARFGFLRNVRSVSSDELSVQSAALVEWFPDDLEASLFGELVQFAALLDTDIGRQATSMYRLIREKPCNRAFQTWIYCCACISF